MSGTSTEQPSTQPADGAAIATPVVRRTATTDVALVATFAAFIAVCTLVGGIPGPSGVPFTLQTFAVVLAGLVLGARRGLAAVALYLVVGFAGVPVFAEHTAGLAVLSGPTGGYLVGFLAAAVVAGALVRPALAVAGRLQPRAGVVLASVLVGVGVSALLVHLLRHQDAALRWPVLVAVAAVVAAGLSFLLAGPARRLSPSAPRYVALALAALVASPVVLDAFGIAGLMWRAGLSFHAAFAVNLPFVPGDVVKSCLAALVAVTVFRAFPDLARTRR
jgi:biotin transport system substrate-specific component